MQYHMLVLKHMALATLLSNACQISVNDFRKKN